MGYIHSQSLLQPVSMSKLKEEQDERNSQFMTSIDELKQSLESFRENQASLIEEVNETQKSLCASLREELQSQTSKALEEQRQIFGKTS